MKTRRRFAPALLALTLLAGCARKPEVPRFSITVEPHHKLIYEGRGVRVFEVHLDARQSTAPHFHANLYYLLGLPDQLLPDRDFPYIQLTDDEKNADGSEPHMTKSGFTGSFVKGETLPQEIRTGPVVETNPMDIPIHYLEIELMQVSDSDKKLANAKKKNYRESRYSSETRFAGGTRATFEDFFVSGQRVKLEPGGVLAAHRHEGDYLLISASKISLKFGRSWFSTRMPEGRVRWKHRGPVPAIKNAGTRPAYFVELEFKPVPSFKPAQ